MRARLPLMGGLLIGAVGTALGIGTLSLSGSVAENIPRFFLLAVSFALLAYFPHCLAHFIAGRLVGLRFSHYVLGSSPLQRLQSRIIRLLDSALPRLGIRLESESRKSASYRQRLVMFSSGVITSTVLPIIPATIASTTLAWPLGGILPLLWLLYLVFGVFFSPRYGDLSRIKVKP